MERRVLILAGVPGAGKSTWANGFQKFHRDGRGGPYREVDICSADDFFVTPSGYKFDPNSIGKAHSLCLRRFVANFDHYGEVTDTIVDNTNLSVLDWAPYIRVGMAFGAAVEVHFFDGEFANIHGVPPDKMVLMRQKFDHLVATEVFISGGKTISRTFPDVQIIFHK